MGPGRLPAISELARSSGLCVIFVPSKTFLLSIETLFIDEFYVYIQDQELFFWGAGQHKTDLYPNLPSDNIPEVVSILLLLSWRI